MSLNGRRASTRGGRWLGTLVAALATGCGPVQMQGSLQHSFPTSDAALPVSDLKIRTEIRQLAQDYSRTLVEAADRLALSSTDPETQRKALLWKLAATSAVRQAAFRAEPQLALVDTWALGLQLEVFLTRGPGVLVFPAGRQTLAGTIGDLARGAAGIAERHLKPEAMVAYRELAARYAEASPVLDLELHRAPITDRWRTVAAKLGAVLDTVGSPAQAVADVSDRLEHYSQSVPEELRWQADLYAGEARGLVVALDTRLDGVIAALRSERVALAEFARDAGAAIDDRWLGGVAAVQSALGERLQADGGAFDAAIQRERKELYTLIDTQRAAVALDTERISKSLVEVTLTRTHQMTRELAILGGLAVLALGGMSFLSGVMAERAGVLRRGSARGTS
jgi:hypothetical protein